MAVSRVGLLLLLGRRRRRLVVVWLSISLLGWRLAVRLLVVALLRLLVVITIGIPRLIVRHAGHHSEANCTFARDRRTELMGCCWIRPI